MKLLFILLLPFSLLSQTERYSGVDLRVKSFYGLLGIGYAKTYFPSEISRGIEEERNLNNYCLSGKAGIYVPWLNRSTLIGFMTNVFYERYYKSSLTGYGANTEILSGTFGLDLAVYPFSCAGKGPYFHVLNGFSKTKFNTDFGYDGMTPYGYGLTAGIGAGIPWMVSYPEHLNLSLDYDYRKTGSEEIKTLSFYVSVGGFF
ncbi:hypothetical protein JW890_00375 [candidate division WOR-3 bacterium]|nr:hypothetical protein [candidate division WOR-3 bacterium]